jgi:hypothetical protein
MIAAGAAVEASDDCGVAAVPEGPGDAVASLGCRVGGTKTGNSGASRIAYEYHAPVELSLRTLFDQVARRTLPWLITAVGLEGSKEGPAGPEMIGSKGSH